MWHIGSYLPVTLFSLRPANSTVSGGKTLIAPTPYAIKMALLDVTIRQQGRQTGIDWWGAIRDLDIAIALPENLVVVKSFQRILRPKTGDHNGNGLIGSWGSNIVYREYVHYEVADDLMDEAGWVRIALQHPDDADLPLEWLFSQIDYFGKRGGFFQFIDYDGLYELPSSFTPITQPAESFSLGGLMQLMDDCGRKMTFAHADVFDKKTIRLNRDDGRLLNTVIFPYQQVNAGRSFTAYQRLDAS